ncbi:MAG: ParB/RepB/Spo0J family partition protein [Saccharofermentans sp.]|jgi:ParB family chromosome partitioning protein|nr:ParB/RepB/Spo0J family partition protein [Saccharofermentans sp.]
MAQRKVTGKKPVKAPAKKSSASTAKTTAKTAKPSSGSSKGLGKGLGALLSTDGIPENAGDSVVDLKINDISPNVDQPRKIFNEEALNELAASIKENGVIQPIIVQKKGNGYIIVAGERRWRAARIAGLKVIPAIIRDLTDQQTMEQALIENLQREDLNPLEEAFAMDNLLKSPGMNQEKLAKKLGKPRATIANTVRLINIDESLQDYIRNGDLSAGHAKALLALKSSEDQRKAANVILAKDMTVRQAEDFIKRYINDLENPDAAKKSSKKELSAQFMLSTKEVETKLKKSLGSKVRLKILDSDAGRGKIIIDYKNYDDLDRLIEMLK